MKPSSFRKLVRIGTGAAVLATASIASAGHDDGPTSSRILILKATRFDRSVHELQESLRHQPHFNNASRDRRSRGNGRIDHPGNGHGPKNAFGQSKKLIPLVEDIHKHATHVLQQLNGNNPSFTALRQEMLTIDRSMDRLVHAARKSHPDQETIRAIHGMRQDFESLRDSLRQSASRGSSRRGGYGFDDHDHDHGQSRGSQGSIPRTGRVHTTGSSSGRRSF